MKYLAILAVLALAVDAQANGGYGRSAAPVVVQNNVYAAPPVQSLTAPVYAPPVQQFAAPVCGSYGGCSPQFGAPVYGAGGFGRGLSVDVRRGRFGGGVRVRAGGFGGY